MNRFDRFLTRNNRFGIKNLMLYIIIGNALVFLLAQTDRGQIIISYFVLDSVLILKGQIWRLFSFIFIPPTFSLLSLVLSLYFYYMVGTALEREWGVLKFNVYYFSGVILTALYSLLTGAFASSFYLNLSLFFAFAMLFPDFQILLFFIIPIKIKYLAYLDAALFLFSIIFNRFPGNLLPLIAIANFFLFFYSDIIAFFRSRRTMGKTVKFKNNVRRMKRERGYLHRCTTCGKTDTDYPDMEFRYCSLCRNYACYCEEHILDHTHIT